jgi:hypothetical protein
MRYLSIRMGQDRSHLLTLRPIAPMKTACLSAVRSELIWHITPHSCRGPFLQIRSHKLVADRGPILMY